MYYSTYRNLAYGGMIVAPFLLFGMFWGISGDLGFAIGLAVFLTIIIVPLQFFQLSRMKEALDSHDGSIPMGNLALWELEDDTDDEPLPDALKPTSGDPPALKSSGDSSGGTARYCPSCGKASWVAGERFCPFCGASL